MFYLFEQGQEAVAPFGAGVEREPDFGHKPQPGPAGEFAANETGRSLERPAGVLSFRLGPEYAVKDARLAQVRRHFCVRDRHKTDPGIMHLAAQNVADFLNQQFLHAPLTGSCHV